MTPLQQLVVTAIADIQEAQDLLITINRELQ